MFESLSNKIKSAKRIDYGYRNDEHFFPDYYSETSLLIAVL